jgi:hypothetical protein
MILKTIIKPLQVLQLNPHHQVLKTKQQLPLHNLKSNVFYSYFVKQLQVKVVLNNKYLILIILHKI